MRGAIYFLIQARRVINILQNKLGREYLVQIIYICNAYLYKNSSIFYSNLSASIKISGLSLKIKLFFNSYQKKLSQNIQINLKDIFFITVYSLFRGILFFLMVKDCNQFIIMQDDSNEYKTMYIKFPTVTKLQYPIESIPDKTTSNFKSQLTFRQNFLRKTEIKIDLLKGSEQFKIVHLPSKGQIMNICTMQMRSKQRQSSPNGENSGDKDLKRKVYSVRKLNTFHARIDSDAPQRKGSLINRSSSIKDLKKGKLTPSVTFDYFQIYPQISRLLALTFGVVLVNQGAHKLRKSKIQLSNNGLLIKQTIKKRIWWTVMNQQQLKHTKKDEIQSNIHFIWTTQTLPSKIIQKMNENNQNCFRKIDSQNYQIIFQRSFDKVVSQLKKVKQLLFTQWQEEPVKLKNWIGKLQKQQEIFHLIPDQLIINNHLHNHWEITNKKLLFKNMSQYYRMNNIDPYTKMPKTHHITCYNWQDIIKRLKDEERVWIMKPGQFTNRGNGIKVFRTTKDAINQILNHPPKNDERTYLLQQYITPMLYDQRKFDIRCYMLGVQVRNILKFFWYEEGYIRTASQKFSTKKVAKSIHLTNDAVQKYTPNYDKYESANKLSYHQLDKYCLNNTTFNFYQEILPQMKRIARDICHSVGDSRKIGSKKGVSFEIYGLDFLVDQKGKPWLCQVNTNPSLEICCSLLSRIIPQLIENSIRLVVDTFLPPSKKTPQYAQSFITNNKYSLIYSNRIQQTQ